MHDVTIPALNRVGYADGLNAAFTAIENNEALLANHDFVKGDKGDSVNIEKISLSQNSDMLAKLKSAIKNGTEPNPINGVAWDSLLNDELYVLYKTEIDNGVEKKVAVSSLYYTFVDGRFVNSNVGKLTINDFDEEVDLSCILVYENGVFKRLNNVFPTMYFEDGKGLCWKVNGQRTGLPVQGVPGNDGKNSDVIIVRVNQTDIDDNGKGLVSQRWNKTGGWKDITNINELDGYTCFALAPSYELVNGQYVITNASSFYVGTLIVESDKLYVLCKPELSLQQTFGSAIFIEAMQNISLLTNSDTIVTPKGLFVPMKTLGDLAQGEKQPIHLIAATSINNEQGNENELRNDMIVVPVNQTDLVVNRDTNVCVDKFLYVKMSDELIDTINKRMSDTDPHYEKVNKDSILKYKMCNIILTNNIERPIYPTEYCYLEAENAFDDNGVLNINNVVNTENFNNLIPAAYDELIKSNTGFYQWALDATPSEYDPENTYPFGVSYDNVKNGDIARYLKTIYTKTMTPGLADDILLINTLVVDSDDFFEDFVNGKKKEDEDNTGGDNTGDKDIYTYTGYVEGIVMEIDGTPIIGVTVKLEGTTIGTMTDSNGYYKIPIKEHERGSNICFSYIGYEGATINIDGRNTINVTMLSKFDAPSEQLKPVTDPNNPAIKNILLCSACSDYFDCIEPCPAGAISYDYKNKCCKISKDDCIGCGQCMEICPYNNIDITKLNTSGSGSNDDIYDYTGYVEGTVTDIKGNPIALASVQIKGTTTNITTNIQGQYKIQVSREQMSSGSLVVSALGYADKTVSISGKNTVDIKLFTEIDREPAIDYTRCSYCGAHFTNAVKCPSCGRALVGDKLPAEKTVSTFSLRRTMSMDSDGSDDPVTPDVPEIKPDTTQKYILLRGTDLTSLRFEKFVPIYVNDYRVNRDSSFNINYNVSITGDELNPHRNLSVHGDINCENINVYELSAAGKIRDIYTEDEIVGTKGINLAQDKFIVDELGNTNVTSITSPYGELDFVKSEGVSTNTVNVMNNDVNVLDVHTENNGLVVTVDQLNSMSIVGNDTNKPTIDSSIPMFFGGGSGVYCTNNKSKLPYKNNGGSGLTTIKDKIDYIVDEAGTDTSRKKSVKNTLNNYCGNRKTNYNSIVSNMGTTYIQMEDPKDTEHRLIFDGKDSNAQSSIRYDMDIATNQPVVGNKIKTQACAAFEVTEYNPNNALKCEFTFDKPFAFAISMNSCCSNGLWPQLHGGSSYIKFRVIAKVGSSGYIDVTDIKRDNDNYNLKCNFTCGILSWTGYEQSLRSGNSRWDTYIRTISFVAKPHNFTAKLNAGDVQKANGGKITIYIVPTIYSEFKCEDHWFYSKKYLIDYLAMTKFIPYNESCTAGEVRLLGSVNPDSFIFTNKSLTSTQMGYTKMSYEVSDTSSELETTLIENTGFIYTDGQNCGFGIGNVTTKDTAIGMYYYDKKDNKKQGLLIKDLFATFGSAISNYNV